MEWIQIFRNEELVGYAQNGGQKLKVIKSNGQISVGIPKKIQMPPRGHKNYFLIKTCIVIGYVSIIETASESIFLTEEEIRKWQNFLNTTNQNQSAGDRSLSLDAKNKILIKLQSDSLDRINAEKKRDRIVNQLSSARSRDNRTLLWRELIAIENNLASTDYLDESELVYIFQSIEEAVDIKASFLISLQVDEKNWSIYFWKGRVIWATGLNLDVWHHAAREHVSLITKDDLSGFYGFSVALPTFTAGTTLNEAELSLLFGKTFGIEKAIEALLGSITSDILVDIIQSVRFTKKTKGDNESVIFYSTQKIYLSSNPPIGQDYAMIIDAALAKWKNWKNMGVEDLSPYDYISQNHASSINASKMYGFGKLEEGSQILRNLIADNKGALSIATSVAELIKADAVHVSFKPMQINTDMTTRGIVPTVNVCVIHRSPKIRKYYERLLLAIGCNVDLHDTGTSDALSFLVHRADKPSLIFIGSDETQLLQHIKSIDTPVVLISDNYFTWLAKNRIRSKPKYHQLLTLINKLLTDPHNKPANTTQHDS